MPTLYKVDARIVRGELRMIDITSDNIEELNRQVKQKLPYLPGLSYSIDDKVCKSFKDYNKAVLKTFEEYAKAHIASEDIDVYEAISRVAMHLYGCYYNAQDECKYTEDKL